MRREKRKKYFILLESGEHVGLATLILLWMHTLIWCCWECMNDIHLCTNLQLYMAFVIFLPSLHKLRNGAKYVNNKNSIFIFTLTSYISIIFYSIFQVQWQHQLYIMSRPSAIDVVCHAVNHSSNMYLHRFLVDVLCDVCVCITTRLGSSKWNVFWM